MNKIIVFNHIIIQKARLSVLLHSRPLHGLFRWERRPTECLNKPPVCSVNPPWINKDRSCFPAGRHFSICPLWCPVCSTVTGTRWTRLDRGNRLHRPLETARVAGWGVTVLRKIWSGRTLYDSPSVCLPVSDVASRLQSSTTASFFSPPQINQSGSDSVCSW